jgi:hypothetical protein
VVGVTGDQIDAYLARLRASLRTPPERTAQILAEAEDHLRESAVAGEAAGLTEPEAQLAAISAFGSVRAVVRAHNLRAGQVARDLVMTALKLGWIGMFSIAASGFVAWAMDALFGRAFVGGLPGAYLLALMYWRPGGVRVLPSGFFPLAAAAVFTAGALALIVCAFTGGPFGGPAGPGSFLSGAVIAVAMALAYGARARHALRSSAVSGEAAA